MLHAEGCLLIQSSEQRKTFVFHYNWDDCSIRTFLVMHMISIIIIIIKFTTREGIHKRQSLYKVPATKRKKQLSHHTQEYITLMNYAVTQTDKNYKTSKHK